MFAVGDGLHDQVFGNAVAADQLNHDIDVGVRDDQITVTNDFALTVGELACALDVEVGHHDDLNRPASAGADFGLITLQDGEGASTNGADAKKANFDRFHDEVNNDKGFKNAKGEQNQQAAILSDDNISHRIKKRFWRCYTADCRPN